MHLKIKTLVACKITLLNILSYQSFIYIFRNFTEYQSQENEGLNKQFKRTKCNGRIKRNLFKDKNFV